MAPFGGATAFLFVPGKEVEKVLVPFGLNQPKDALQKHGFLSAMVCPQDGLGWLRKLARLISLGHGRSLRTST